LNDIRKRVCDFAAVEQRGSEHLAVVLDRGIDKLSAAMSQISEVISKLTDVVQQELCNLASVMECGFEEIKWELQQQTRVLKSIDHTLKNPSQTQSHEWRRMAEQLRERGCLDEAAEWFTKALTTNPLDYRTYVGLAMTYLQGRHFDRARELLEKSLPHAPKCKRAIVDGNCEFMKNFFGDGTELQLELAPSDDVRKFLIARVKRCFGLSGKRTKDPRRMSDEEANFEADGGSEQLQSHEIISAEHKFDYRSNSYRLIGRIHACKEEWTNAVSALRSAVDLSPEYAEGNYDYAQYCVQSGDRDEWAVPLRKAILSKPAYWYMAWAERNFAPIRQDLLSLLKAMRSEVRHVRSGVT
jgi:tetratricopeptide (TPR) repeat protein